MEAKLSIKSFYKDKRKKSWGGVLAPGSICYLVGMKIEQNAEPSAITEQKAELKTIQKSQNGY
jgi:hypothetical protein